MDKTELIELLKDPDVVSTLKELIKQPANKQNMISQVDSKKISRVVTWFDKEAGKKSELNLFQKKDLLQLISKFGLRQVKLVLKQALDSPLNADGQFMKQFLTNLSWCVKAGNFTKIKDGNYDVAFKKKDGAHIDTNDEQLTGLE